MKEEFKVFVSKHPELINFVNKNMMTWQKFYDMYSLYGDNSEAWSSYINNNSSVVKDKTINSLQVSDIVDAIKKVDVDSVQKNITTINKALTLISSLLTKDEVVNDYTPRPLYKKFED